MENIKGKLLWGLAIAYSLVLLPLLRDHADYLFHREYYQWAAVLVVVVAVWVYRAWKVAPPATQTVRIWCIQWAQLALIPVGVVAYLYLSGWVGMVGVILSLGILAALLSCQRKVDRLFGLWALLFLLVRPPYQIEGRVLRFFEGMSSVMASKLIDLFEIYHVVQGEFLTMGEHEVSVEKVCSEYFSIFSVLALTAVYVVWRRRPVFHAVGLLLSSFLAAMVVNGIRLALVAIVLDKTGVVLIEGWWRALLLIVSVVSVTPVILSFDAFFGFIFSNVAELRRGKPGFRLSELWDAVVALDMTKLLSVFRKPAHTDGGKKISSALLSVQGIGLFVVLGFAVPSIYYELTAVGDKRVRFMHTEGELKVLDQEQITFDRPGWKVLSMDAVDREFGSIWGQFSQVWRLEYKGQQVLLAVDYPFDKWHDVKTCYANEGWKMVDENLLVLSNYQGWGASETEMSLPTGDYGYVLCSHMTFEGEAVQSKPTDHRWAMVKYYLHPKQWAPPFGQSVDKDKNTFYQTQMMVRSSFPLDEETKRETAVMYGEFRAQVSQLLSKMDAP